MKIKKENIKKSRPNFFILIFICFLLSVNMSWADPNFRLRQDVNQLKADVSKIREYLDKLLHPDGNQAEDQGIVDVIVSDTPSLSIPREFKDAVRQLGGRFIIIGNKRSVRMLSLNGDYFNPCPGGSTPSIFSETTHTCKFSATLSETLQLLSKKFDPDDPGAGGCGVCPGNGIANRPCKLTTHKYSCTNQSSTCDDNCRLP